LKDKTKAIDVKCKNGKKWKKLDKKFLKVRCEASMLPTHDPDGQLLGLHKVVLSDDKLLQQVLGPMPWKHKVSPD
jgi:hypothetical protein